MAPTLEQIRNKLPGILEKAETPEQVSIVNFLQDATNEALGSTAERRNALLETLEFDIVTDESVIGWTYLFQQVKATMEILGVRIGDDKRRKRLCVRGFEGLFSCEEVDRAELNLEEILSARTPSSVNRSPFSESAQSQMFNRDHDNSFGVAKALGSRWSDSQKYSGEISDSSHGMPVWLLSRPVPNGYE